MIALLATDYTVLVDFPIRWPAKRFLCNAGRAGESRGKDKKNVNIIIVNASTVVPNRELNP